MSKSIECIIYSRDLDNETLQGMLDVVSSQFQKKNSRLGDLIRRDVLTREGLAFQKEEVNKVAAVYRKLHRTLRTRGVQGVL